MTEYSKESRAAAFAADLLVGVQLYAALQNPKQHGGLLVNSDRQGGNVKAMERIVDRCRARVIRCIDAYRRWQSDARAGQDGDLMARYWRYEGTILRQDVRHALLLYRVAQREMRDVRAVAA